MVSIQFIENEMTIKVDGEIGFQEVLERKGDNYFLQFNEGDECVRISEAKFAGWYIIPDPCDSKVDFKFENGIYYFDYKVFNFGMNCKVTRNDATH